MTVAIAQLVERQIVVLDVAGSSPVSHPRPRNSGLFYFPIGFQDCRAGCVGLIGLANVSRINHVFRDRPFLSSAVGKFVSKSTHPTNYTLGLIAAAIGGAIGYFVFFWMARQGFYTLIIPPALLGLAGGLATRGHTQVFGIICGIAGLLLAIVIEWQFAPFIADESFVYFLTHLHQRKPLTLLMLAIGPVISYRLALGWDDSSNRA